MPANDPSCDWPLSPLMLSHDVEKTSGVVESVTSESGVHRSPAMGTYSVKNGSSLTTHAWIAHTGFVWNESVVVAVFKRSLIHDLAVG